MRYSIIYAVIRPEISERISVGLIIVDGDKVDVRYSQQKLDALRGLFPQKEYEFVSQVVTSMPTDGSVNSVAAIDDDQPHADALGNLGADDCVNDAVSHII